MKLIKDLWRLLSNDKGLHLPMELTKLFEDEDLELAILHWFLSQLRVVTVVDDKVMAKSQSPTMQQFLFRYLQGPPTDTKFKLCHAVRCVLHNGRKIFIVMPVADNEFGNLLKFNGPMKIKVAAQ
jgi:hypothetical protein